MKSSLLIQILVTVAFCSATLSLAENRTDKFKLKDLLPQIGDVDGWVPKDEAEYAAGEDLFLLIDGGADVYHEYGFKAAVFQTYATADEKSINLEVYEMDSQEAAYGIYTFKTGSDGVPIDVGHDGWVESYYLNFWKGNILVTIVGLSADTDVLVGIEKIAKAVDSKLKIQSKRPQITSYLPNNDLQINGVTYIEGNLALFNQYPFDEDDIFGVKEGVIGKYDDHTVFVFEYESQEESAKWHDFVRNRLEKSERFDDVVHGDMLFEVSDHRNNRLRIKRFRRWILIILGDGGSNDMRTFDQLEATLKRE